MKVNGSFTLKILSFENLFKKVFNKINFKIIDTYRTKLEEPFF